jgi:hypothetical protein
MMIRIIKTALAVYALTTCNQFQVAYSETFSTQLSGFAANLYYPYLAETTFNFGVQFKSIDSVRFEVTMPSGLISIDTGDPNHIKFTSLQLSIFNPEASPLSPATVVEASSTKTVYGSAISIPPATPALIDAKMSPLFGLRPWPSYLLAGRGAVVMHMEDFEMRAPGGAFETIRPAEGVSSVRIVIDGVAVPEPSMATAGSVCLGVTVMRRKR